MKQFIGLICLPFCISFFNISISQQSEIVPFIDFNKWFRCVENSTPKFIEMQEIKGYKAGDYVVAYIDLRGNLRIYDGQKRHDISNMISIEYAVSDKIVAWNIAGLLHVWQNGITKTLTAFSDSSNYVVKDDILVYTDTRYNSFIVHWNNKEYPIKTSTTDLYLTDSEKIGENIIAYEDNGGLYKIFYKGESYEVGIWNGNIDLKSGTDIVAFNDPNTRTFAVFDKGNFIDVENQWAKNYKAGRGFVVYEDAMGKLMEYRNGETKELASFPSKWDVVDDIIVYENNGFTYCNVNGTITKAANFKIEEYKIKNATIVFRNLNGGLTAVIDGKIIELTNMPNAEFEIYGNSVLIKLFNNSFFVYQQGKLIRI